MARRAADHGLDTTTQAALERALFRDDFSTREEVTELSGRGVGLAAVRRACEERSGTISVTSERGRGTRFRFSFPARDVAVSERATSPG
ncbi:MAG: ATP-binding protein [Gemmatimonadales bacterium]